MSDWQSRKRTAMILGILGIATEVIAIWLLVSKRVPSNIGTPLIIGGMLLAFVPMFLIARKGR